MSNKKTVTDYMLPASKVAITNSNASLKKALELMTEFSLGVCLFRNENGSLEGILTDGDLRRLILKVQNPLPALLVTDAIEFGTRNPHTAGSNDEISRAIDLMDKNRIWDLPVIGFDGNILGLLNRHNLG
jgi:CBS domain-containing protein